jgi:RNA polymerase sigma factor (sigma-70 family)
MRGSARKARPERPDFTADETGALRKSPVAATSLPVREWLTSPYLQRLARRIAYQYRVPSEDVPDLVQELRLALWKAGSESRVNVRWIAQTASHKAIDFLRRKIRDPEPMPEGLDPPNSGVGSAELICLLHSRVARLPARLQRFYRLRYLQGFSQREISTKQGICRASVRWLESECVKRLRIKPPPPED